MTTKEKLHEKFDNKFLSLLGGAHEDSIELIKEFMDDVYDLARDEGMIEGKLHKEKIEPPKHGNHGYINYGCRCDICVAAHKQSGDERRAGLANDEPCFHPDCENTGTFARSICSYHYNRLGRLVRMGRRTWKELEDDGVCTGLKSKRGHKPLSAA